MSLTVSVTDANDTPVGITIDSNKIDENLKKGTTIGNLSAIDEDAGDSMTSSVCVLRSQVNPDAILDCVNDPQLTTLDEIINYEENCILTGWVVNFYRCCQYIDLKDDDSSLVEIFYYLVAEKMAKGMVGAKSVLILS